MTGNGYLDHSVQKAFMPSVPGCIEHYTKLAAAIKEAHARHKSLAVCWLDLTNAYGSVHHDLITFSLKHYGISDQFIAMAVNLYRGLSASIHTPSYSTPNIPINKGVFQGDPLSVIIFNTVMNTYIDTINQTSSQFKLFFLQLITVTWSPAVCRRYLFGFGWSC